MLFQIIVYTLENKMLGKAFPYLWHCWYCNLDLLASVYNLVHMLTFKTRAISPNMWSVFQLTYNLFKMDVVDFLDGSSAASIILTQTFMIQYR